MNTTQATPLAVTTLDVIYAAVLAKREAQKTLAERIEALAGGAESLPLWYRLYQEIVEGDFRDIRAMKALMRDCPRYFHTEGRDLRLELVTKQREFVAAGLDAGGAEYIGRWVYPMAHGIELASLHSAETLLNAMAAVRAVYSIPEVQAQCPRGVPVVIENAIAAGARFHYDAGNITAKILTKCGYNRTVEGKVLTFVHGEFPKDKFAFGKVTGVAKMSEEDLAKASVAKAATAAKAAADRVAARLAKKNEKKEKKAKSKDDASKKQKRGGK